MAQPDCPPIMANRGPDCSGIVAKVIGCPCRAETELDSAVVEEVRNASSLRWPTLLCALLICALLCLLPSLPPMPALMT